MHGTARSKRVTMSQHQVMKGTLDTAPMFFWPSISQVAVFSTMMANDGAWGKMTRFPTPAEWFFAACSKSVPLCARLSCPRLIIIASWTSSQVFRAMEGITSRTGPGFRHQRGGFNPQHACFTINKCRNEAANRVGCYLNITTKKTYWHVLKNLLWDAMGMYGSNSLGPAL